MNYVPPDAGTAFNADSIPASESRAALEKILQSPEFIASPQLRGFLTYIVEAHLAGTGHLLKGQTIGTVVLGRAEGYDSQRDPIVRVEANRLRRTLATYYENSGDKDPVRLIVERGSYNPRFERLAPIASEAPPAVAPTAKDEPKPAAAPKPDRLPPVTASALTRGHGRGIRVVGIVIGVILASIAIALLGTFLFVETRPESTPIAVATGGAAPTGAGVVAAPREATPYLPSVDVMPFATQASGDVDERGEELVSSLTVALARFPELRVLATGDRPADFRMDGEIVVSGRKATVAMRLSATHTTEVVWSASIELTLSELMTRAGIDRIVAIATTAVAPQFGAIAQLLSRDDSAMAGALSGYHCIIDAQLQSYRFNDGSWQRLDTCLRSLIARYPTFATAWASRSLLLIEAYRLDPDPIRSRTALREADELARRALELQPTNVRAMTAVAAVAFGKGDLEAARNISLRAITANPLDPLSRSQYVLALLASGYLDQALQQSAAARLLDPAHVSFYDSLEYLANFGKRVPTNPLAGAVMADVPLLPYGAIARVLAYDDAGQTAARDEAVQALYDLMPLFASDMPSALRRQFPPSPFSMQLQAALHQAGVGP